MLAEIWAVAHGILDAPGVTDAAWALRVAALTAQRQTAGRLLQHLLSQWLRLLQTGSLIWMVSQWFPALLQLAVYCHPAAGRVAAADSEDRRACSSAGEGALTVRPVGWKAYQADPLSRDKIGPKCGLCYWS